LSSEVQITITAFDEATETINNVANSVNQANAEIEDSSSSMTSTLQSANAGVTNTALGFNNMATSGMGLYMGINNIENAQVSLDRAHVNVQKSTNAVTDAQNKYNDAVAKYGPNSKEAQDALAKLNTAHDALTVAQERADEAQRNYNNTVAFSVMSIIPSLITGFTSVMAIAPGVSSAVDGISGAMDFLAANPIVLVIAGIALLVTGLIYAYNNCAPFRDAINDIGRALGGAILTAAKDLEGALSFLWNDVLKPIADFLEKVFITAINDVVGAIKPFQDAIGAVGGVVGDIEKGIGGLGSALSHLCFAHATPAAEEFNKTLEDSIRKSDALSGKVSNLTGSLSGITGAAGGPGALAPISGLGAAARLPMSITNNIRVEVQGSVDMKTADYVVKKIQDELKNVMIEPTSSGSPMAKRIRLIY
jgi:hypothetical protein